MKMVSGTGALFVGSPRYTCCVPNRTRRARRRIDTLDPVIPKGIAMFSIIGMVAAATVVPPAGSPAAKPIIRKLGTIDCDMVETTPIVWRGRLYRFEYVRDNYKPNTTGRCYFRFDDVETGEPTPPFAAGWHLGSAFADGDRVYAFGVNKWGGTEIRVFWSDDIKIWASRTALHLRGWEIFNTSVCKDADGYTMAFEIGAPPQETGIAFTMRFAKSSDLLNWRLTPVECVFSKDRYTACPALRFLDGWYYMIYLEARPGPTYEPHIVRSKDLVRWESSPLNPMMQFSDEDKSIANPRLSAEQRQRIAAAVNLNNSDVDLCEIAPNDAAPPALRGGAKSPTVVIYYSWGNQQGIEHLAAAVYDGTLAEFLRRWFPQRP
jgi:hypothetical protein